MVIWRSVLYASTTEKSFQGATATYHFITPRASGTHSFIRERDFGKTSTEPNYRKNPVLAVRKASPSKGALRHLL